MHVLVVDAFGRGRVSRRRFEHWKDAILKACSQCVALADLEFEIRRFDDLSDLTYESNDGSSFDITLLKKFDRIDVIAADGDLPLRPWSPEAVQMYRLFSMCAQSGKCLFASNYASGMVLAAVNSSSAPIKLIRSYPEGGQLKDLAGVAGAKNGELFLDAETGDCYSFSPSARVWQFSFNCGIRPRRKGVKLYETRRHDVRDINELIMTNGIHRDAVPHDESRCSFLRQHYSHFLFDGINCSSDMLFPVPEGWSLYVKHPFNTGLKTGDVLAVNEETVVVFESNNIVGTRFGIWDDRYKETKRILMNFFREKMDDHKSGYLFENKSQLETYFAGSGDPRLPRKKRECTPEGRSELAAKFAETMGFSGSITGFSAATTPFGPPSSSGSLASPGRIRPWTYAGIGGGLGNVSPSRLNMNPSPTGRGSPSSSPNRTKGRNNNNNNHNSPNPGTASFDGGMFGKRKSIPSAVSTSNLSSPVRDINTSSSSNSGKLDKTVTNENEQDQQQQTPVKIHSGEYDENKREDIRDTEPSNHYDHILHVSPLVDHYELESSSESESDDHEQRMRGHHLSYSRQSSRQFLKSGGSFSSPMSGYYFGSPGSIGTNNNYFNGASPMGNKLFQSRASSSNNNSPMMTMTSPPYYRPDSANMFLEDSYSPLAARMAVVDAAVDRANMYFAKGENFVRKQNALLQQPANNNNNNDINCNHRPSEGSIQLPQNPHPPATSSPSSSSNRARPHSAPVSGRLPPNLFITNNNQTGPVEGSSDLQQQQHQAKAVLATAVFNNPSSSSPQSRDRKSPTSAASASNRPLFTPRGTNVVCGGGGSTTSTPRSHACNPLARERQVLGSIPSNGACIGLTSPSASSSPFVAGDSALAALLEPQLKEVGTFSARSMQNWQNNPGGISASMTDRPANSIWATKRREEMMPQE